MVGIFPDYSNPDENREKKEIWEPDKVIFRSIRDITESNFFESLILAQDERWRRALGMQVERVSQETSGRRVSNA